MEKKCSDCRKVKNLCEFPKNHRNKDGYRGRCKICTNKNNKEYRDRTIDDRKETSKKYYQKNKEKMLGIKKLYSDSHKEQKIAYDKIYRQKNKERIRNYQIVWEAGKRKSDAMFRIKNNLRARVYRTVKHEYKSKKTYELLGCNTEFLKEHLQSQFTEGMNWENYGPEWHVDHIIPCYKFDLTDLEQQKICFHYSNLRPLWKLDNISRRFN